MRSLPRIGIGLLLLAIGLGAPAAAKQGYSLLTAEEANALQASMRGKAAVPPDLAAVSDEELWDYVPTAEQKRAVFLGPTDVGCPVHGTAIFRVGGGFYPWKRSANIPWKVQCPVGGELYPTNDFGAYLRGGKAEKLDTRKPYVDDGSGWVDDKGRRFYFVGYWVFWQRWYDVLKAITAFTDAYFATGDERYAHRATVLFCALAEQYPKMDYPKQGVQGCGGMILPWCWENQDVVTRLAVCYDRLFPYLAQEGDEALRAFLAKKTDLGPRKQIEQKFVQTVARVNFTTDMYWSNECDHQLALATLALAWDNNDSADGITTREMVDWIFTQGGDNSLEELLFNSTYRDGFPCEGAIGYSQAIASRQIQIAELMKATGRDLFKEFPRLKQVAGVWIDMTLADGHAPSLGDSGSVLGSGRPWDARMLHIAWENTRDPKFAAALTQMRSTRKTPYSPDRTAEFAEALKDYDASRAHRTRNLGGMGLAILESGGPLHPRGLFLYYGSPAGGHAHHDRLNIEFIDHGQSVLPDLGYPDQWGRKATEFTQNTIGHYGVLVDEKGEEDYQAGYLEYIRGMEGIQVVSAHAERGFPGTSLYRRTTALIDLAPSAGYVADVFRVRGGAQHDWSFHLPPVPEWSLEGCALSAPQEKGTLAGEDVAAGAPPPSPPHGGGKEGARPKNGFNWLTKVQRGRPEGAFTFAAKAHPPYPNLRMTMAPGCAQEILVGDHESPRIRQQLPPTMKWLLARNKAAGLGSTFAAVIEACPEAPAVRAVDRLPCKGGKEPLALRVTTAAGTDTLLTDETGEREVSALGFGTFAGKWGFARSDGAGVARAALVAGSLLKTGGLAIRTEPAWRGAITAVDYRNNSFDVECALPPGRLLAGQWAVIHNPRHRTSYEIDRVEALPKGSRVFLTEITPMVGKGYVERVESTEPARGGDRALLLHTDTRWRTYGKDYIWSGDFGPALGGYTLLNEDLSTALEIEECKLMPSRKREWWKPEPAWIRVGRRGAEPAPYEDSDGDGRVGFWVYDFRPGCEFLLPNSLSLERLSPDLWVLTALGSPATVALPAGRQVSRVLLRPEGGKAVSVPCRYDARAKTATFTLPPNLGSPVAIAMREETAAVLGDTQPPTIRDIRVDGQRQKVAPEVEVSSAKLPRSIIVTVEDAATPLDVGGIRVRAGLKSARVGQPGLSLVQADKSGRSAILRIEPEHLLAPPKGDTPTHYTLELVVDDQAVDARQTRCTFGLLLSPAIAPGSIFLSDLEPVKALAHAGVKRDSSYLGGEIRLGGAVYRKGVMVCPEVAPGGTNYGEAIYAVPGKYRTFRAVVGIDQAAGGGSVLFEVQLRKGAEEWRTAFRSGVLGLNTQPQAVNVPLGDATEVRLYTDANGSIASDHAVFANARFEP